MKTPELETERLTLRQIREEDTDAIFNCWMQDEDVSRYMYWKASKDKYEADKFVQFELGNLDNDKWKRWMILLKETNEIIGTCLIYFNDDENNWDISYNLGKAYWGKGYATEAMNRVMEYAKNELAVKECIAIHAVENPESGRVIQKLGFKYEKDVPYECSGGEIKTVGKYYRFVAENDDLKGKRTFGKGKRKRVLSFILAFVILFIVFLFMHKATLLQEGNPLNYSKSFVQLTGFKDYVEITNVDNSDRLKFMTRKDDYKEFFEYIEKEYQVKFDMQMGSGFRFAGENSSLWLEDKTYMKFYSVWEVGEMHFKE